MNPEQYKQKVATELGGGKAKRFMNLVMAKIYAGVQENLAGKVLKRRDGTLARSIQFQVVQEGQQTKGIIGVSGGGGKVGLYASVWEFTGHKAFTVRPVNKKALAFGVGERVSATKVGNIILRKVAHIPAAAPRPFIQPAITDAISYIMDQHAKIFGEVVSGDIKDKWKSKL